jgi:hypothetical protein
MDCGQSLCDHEPPLPVLHPVREEWIGMVLGGGGIGSDVDADIPVSRQKESKPVEIGCGLLGVGIFRSGHFCSRFMPTENKGLPACRWRCCGVQAGRCRTTGANSWHYASPQTRLDPFQCLAKSGQVFGVRQRFRPLFLAKPFKISRQVSAVKMPFYETERASHVARKRDVPCQR